MLREMRMSKMQQPEDFFPITAQQFEGLWSAQGFVFPELAKARHERQALARAAQTRLILRQTEHLMTGIESLPQTGYTAYREFRTRGSRSRYEAAYFLKRARLSAATLRLFLAPDLFNDDSQAGSPAALLEIVQDYLWSICEETSWVLPAHERDLIDLFAAETAYLLAETLLLLGDTLNEEIRHRVRAEIEHRVFEPYLRTFQLHKWYRDASNWNGVCNSSIASAFLLLEPEPTRVQRALSIALDGLRAFIATAFAEDGSSSEGIAYWHYGLFNFVAFAEFLYGRSAGAIDLFAEKKLRTIAAFPAKLQLSASSFASFSDCEEQVRFHPGILTRLMQRTGEESLANLLAQPAEPDSDWRLPMMIRDILWWDGQQPGSIPLEDARLSGGGTARLVTHTEQETPVVLAIKAGHNAEEHNHNDIGSFLLHVAGENLLTDPGRGLYSRDYFGPRRYENLFANSYGHSVPRVDGLLQGTGRDFAGSLLEDDPASRLEGRKRVELEFAAAYPCPELSSARRELKLATTGVEAGTVWLHDHFEFARGNHEVEEAFVTWLECESAGASACIHGRQHDLLLTIEQPSELRFHIESLEEQSKANQKERILKRLSFVCSSIASSIDIGVRMTPRPR